METPNIKLLNDINKVIEKNGYSILENEIRPMRTEQNLRPITTHSHLITEFAGDIMIKLVLNKRREKK